MGPSFSYPVRPWASAKIDAGYRDPAYLHRYGREHRGIDVNLRTGGDTDLGYPVSSMFPGTVVAADVYGLWGGIVVVRADEWVKELVEAQFGHIDVLDLQYAHLRHMTVRVGEPVNAGDTVGTIGQGTFEQYTAHLHLEARRGEFDPARPQQPARDDEREFLERMCLNPEELFNLLPVSDHPNTLAQKAYYTPSRVLSVENPGDKNMVVHPVGDKLYLRGF